MADFETTSGITLVTDNSDHLFQRVEYSGEVEGDYAIPYVRTVDVNTGEELDRYALISESYWRYDGIQLSTNLPIKALRGEFYSDVDAEATSDNEPALIVGPRNGNHIEIEGGTEIMAKANATTKTTLYLNWNGGHVRMGENCILKNGQGYYIQNSGGTDWIAVGINSSNDLYYGYGSYVNSSGNSTYYGNNVRLYTKNKVTVNGQPLFKTNTCTSPTATLNAGVGTTKTANITTISGYTPIGIIEATCNHGQICSMGAFWLSGNTANGSWTNRSSSSTSLYSSFKILHIRTELL